MSAYHHESAYTFRVVHNSRNYLYRRCPRCGQPGQRHSVGRRTLRDVSLDDSVIYEISYSKHFCKRCEMFFSASMDDLAAPGCGFTHRTRRFVLRRLLVDQLDVKTVQEQMERDFHVRISLATIYRWHTEEVLSPAPAVSPIN